MTIKSFSVRSTIGQSIGSFANSINNAIGALNPLSLLEANLTVNYDRANTGILGFSMQYRSSGAANYRADGIVYDATLGTSFEDQISAITQISNYYPRFFLDATSLAARRIGPAALIISEEAATSGDGAYVVGDQELLNREVHIVTADENIAIGASGLVTYYSPSLNSTQTTGINRGPVALSTGDRAYAIFDPVSQSLYIYPTCC